MTKTVAMRLTKEQQRNQELMQILKPGKKVETYLPSGKFKGFETVSRATTETVWFVNEKGVELSQRYRQVRNDIDNGIMVV